MYPASSEGLNRETDRAVYFFTPAFYPLDNFSAHTVEIWGKRFPTAEHAFQWKKFSSTRPDIADQIFEATSPHVVKQISDANKVSRSVTWNDEKVNVMEQILWAKADQHEDVRVILRKTGEREIVENSPVDDFWGIGPGRDGKNMLGKIWINIRNGMS